METPQLAAGAVDALTELLLRPPNFYLMVAAYAVITTAQKTLPTTWTRSITFVRLAPLYPMLLCSAGVWIPDQQPENIGIGSRILVGLILGWACGQLNKVWKQTVQGKDSRIDAARERKRIATGSVPLPNPPTRQIPPGE